MQQPERRLPCLARNCVLGNGVGWPLVVALPRLDVGGLGTLVLDSNDVAVARKTAGARSMAACWS